MGQTFDRFVCLTAVDTEAELVFALEPSEALLLRLTFANRPVVVGLLSNFLPMREPAITGVMS